MCARRRQLTFQFPPKNDPCGEVAVSEGSTVSQQSRMLFLQSVTQVAPKKII